MRDKRLKVKVILKFYFTAESLDRAFDNLLIKYGCAYGSDGLKSAEKLCNIIEERAKLSGLWGYLDGVVSKLTERDRASLKSYSLMRCGVKQLGDSARREFKRAVNKFVRRARGIERFSEEVALACKYYCLLGQG